MDKCFVNEEDVSVSAVYSLYALIVTTSELLRDRESYQVLQNCFLNLFLNK